MRRGPPLWAVSGVPRWSVAPRLRQSWSSLTLSLHHCGPGTGIAAHTAVRARLEGAPSGLDCRMVGGVVGRGSIARAGADEAAVSVAARPGHVSAPAVVEQFGAGVDALHASPFRQRPRRDLGHGVRTIPGVGGQTLGTPPNSAAST